MKFHQTLLSLIFSLNVLSVAAQDPAFHLNFLQKQFHNPASGALSEQHVFSGNFRQQWDAYDNVLASYEQQLAGGRSGFGGYFIYDGTPLEKHSEVALFYNYKIQLAPQTALRIGLQPVLKSKRYLFDKFHFGTPEPNFSIEPDSDVAFNVNAGASLTFRKIHVGTGFKNLLENTYHFDNGLELKGDARIFYFHGEFEVQLEEKFKTRFAGIFRQMKNQQTLDAAATGTWNDLLTAGFSWRPASDVMKWGVLAGLKVWKISALAYFEPQKSILGRTFETVLQFEF